MDESDPCRATSASRMSPHLHVLPGDVWHAPSPAKCLVISLGWGRDPGVGLGHQCWMEVFSVCSHDHVSPLLLCCWQTGDSPPSTPVWGIHLGSQGRDSTLCLPTALCALCSEKNSRDQEGAAGITLPLPTALCVPRESPSHVTGLSRLGVIGHQAQRSASPWSALQGAGTCWGSQWHWWQCMGKLRHRRQAGGTLPTPRMLQVADQLPPCPSRL